MSNPSSLRQPLDLALIGNSCVAAFVNSEARIVWWCFPRFDGDPVFSRLLAGDEEKGFCDVVVKDLRSVDSHYVRNTAIVETILACRDGASLRVTDFAPRFDRYERPFHPPQIVRRIEPVSGIPRIAIRVRATHDYGRPTKIAVGGSNHIRYVDGPQVLRLTTDAPLSYIVNEITFPLTRPMSLVFGQDEPFVTGIDATSREFLDHTRRLLARLVAQPCRAVRMAVRGGARRYHAEPLRLHGDGRDRGGAYDLDSRRRPTPPATGITASAGCGTPSSSSMR